MKEVGTVPFFSTHRDVEMLSDGELVCREKIAGCLKRK
jgi:hypothetical protein